MTLLPFDWDDAAGPVSHRLAAALRAAVTSGRLRPGERLPASRLLAQDLAVSRWVVTDAYEQLTAEGYLTGRTGAGTFVADVDPADHQAPAAGAVQPAAVAAAAVRYDLRPNLPDLRSFPHAAWRAAAARAAAALHPRDLGYPAPQGDHELRQVLTAYLRRVRGLAADPADLVITSGTTHSVALLFRALASTGHLRVAVEDPGWPQMRAAVGAAGLEAVPVPVDGDGLTTQTLSELGVQVACVTPAHQFPTGVALAPGRRQQLLDWAGGSRLVVEDDYDAEFRYDRRPVAALAALGGQRAAYLGSASKTLAPGVRIGWLVVPRRIRAAVLEVLAAGPAGPSTLDQRTLADFIASGSYDTHLRRMRRLYRARRAAVLNTLRALLPGAQVAGLDAGVHCLLELDVVDDTAVVEQLARQGIAAAPLSACRMTQGPSAGLLLGYANLPNHHVSAVAGAIAATLAITQRQPPD